MVVYRSPAKLPFLVNGVARVDAGLSPAAVIARARHHFGIDGHEITCLAGRDDDVRDAALAAGMGDGPADPLQHIDLRAHEPPAVAPPPGIAMRRVEDPAGVRDVATVNEDGTTAYGIPAGTFGAIFATAETIVAPAIEAVLAYDSGQPVATAQVFLHGHIAYVGWVAVMRTAMRRGLGQMVTNAVMRRGFERGATSAVLVASPTGAPLYRRMGFEEVRSLKNAYASPRARWRERADRTPVLY